MLQFLLFNLLMLSVGLILYVIVRSLPRIGEAELAPTQKRSIIERWVASEIPERVDVIVHGMSVKFLRKTKVFLLRIDNILTDVLKSMRSSSEVASTPISFKEITPAPDAPSDLLQK